MGRESEQDRIIGIPHTVRDVFDALPVSILATEGPRHVLVASNAPYRLLYPSLLDIGLGKSIWDTAPGMSDQNVFQQFDLVYATGEPMQVDEWRIQLDFDGTGVQEKYLDIDVFPRRDEGGSIIGLIMMVSDVTDKAVGRLAAQADAAQMTERYASLRDQTTAMQQALLATSVAVVPNVEVAAEYLVATEETAAGGDWFDVIPRDNGVVLVVGDVVGHGVHAAATMAQLRTAVRVSLFSGASIADTLTALDDFAYETPGARSATVVIARLDGGSGELEYCTAGHPPPLVSGPDQPARYLEPSGGGPLLSGIGFFTRTVHLGADEVVFLYSDGIIERPGVPPSSSTVEFADLVTRIGHGGGFPLGGSRLVDRLCSQTIELLIRPTGYSDDITLLAAQRRTPAGPFHLDVPADRVAERAVRAQLRDWLHRVGGDVGAGADIVEHTVTEFVANAVEHAYPAGSVGSVTVDATLDDRGTVHATVADGGVWREPVDTGDRGRGLVMAQLMMPDTAVRRGPAGTTVTASRRLAHPARIVTDPRDDPSIPNRAESTDMSTSMSDDGTLIVTGDVDTLAASVLDGVLARTTHGGTTDLAVDLSSVTHLGSRAVNALFGALARSNNSDATLRLSAPPGSTAFHVMTLVGLPVS